MAISASSVIEVRSNGSDTNSGGFVTGATGTDWSQQTSAQYSVTDGVANGTTTLTSATANFGTDVVGNLVYVQGGTGAITARWKEIISRTNATTIVVDSSTGLTAGTGVTLKIGGALATLNTALAIGLVAGCKVWVKKSSGYTTASTITATVSGTDAARISVEGYDSVRGDGIPAVVTSTNSAATSVISNTGDFWMWRNLTLDGASLSLRGLYLNSVAGNTVVDNCWFKGATQYGFLCAGSSNGAVVSRCLATGNGTSGAHAGFGVEDYEVRFDRCVARDNAGNGFAAVNIWLNAIECLAHDNTLSGFYIDGNNTAPRLEYCMAEGNTLDGLRLADAASFSGAILRHNLFAGNAGYGARSLTTDYSVDTRFRVGVEYNAFYNNALGARLQMPTGSTDIALTANPFLDAAADDFGLNLAEGGGLLVRGLAQAFGLRSSPEPSDGSVSAGAVQNASTSSVGGLRDLWRELTGEFDTEVIPNATVDIYIQRGLEAANLVAGYHFTTDTTTVLLTADTQEYAVLSDCIVIDWLQHNGKDLRKRDVEDWRAEGVDWRAEAAGLPREWAHEGNRIILRPKPSSAAVAAASALVVRYVSTPADFATYGMAQLPSVYHPAPVYYGAALWSAAHPDSALAVQRMEQLMQRFQEMAVALTRDYGARGVQK